MSIAIEKQGQIPGQIPGQAVGNRSVMPWSDLASFPGPPFNFARGGPDVRKYVI